MNQNIRNADVLFSVLLLLRWNACEIYQFLMSYWHTKKASIVCSDTNSTSASPLFTHNIQVLRAVVPQRTSPDMPCIKEHLENLTLVKTVRQQAVACRLQESLFFPHCWGKEEKKSQKDLWKIREARTVFSSFFLFCGILFWVVEFLLGSE